jgi:hypothetical protein
MVVRRSHPTDARVILVDLQPEASDLIEAFLRRAWATFYAPTEAG